MDWSQLPRPRLRGVQPSNTVSIGRQELDKHLKLMDFLTGQKAIARSEQHPTFEMGQDRLADCLRFSPFEDNTEQLNKRPKHLTEIGCESWNEYVDLGERTIWGGRYFLPTVLVVGYVEGYGPAGRASLPGPVCRRAWSSWSGMKGFTSVRRWMIRKNDVWMAVGPPDRQEREGVGMWEWGG